MAASSALWHAARGEQVTGEETLAPMARQHEGMAKATRPSPALAFDVKREK
jgi:hypothetical protein